MWVANASRRAAPEIISQKSLCTIGFLFRCIHGRTSGAANIFHNVLLDLGPPRWVKPPASTDKIQQVTGSITNVFRRPVPQIIGDLLFATGSILVGVSLWVVVIAMGFFYI